MKTNKRNKRSQRPSVLYNKLPKQLGRKDFNRYIKPHLSVGARGPDPKISLFKIFNHILYVLHTGMQWYNLKPRGVSWQAVYYHHNHWSKDGSYQRVFASSLVWLSDNDLLDLSILHGDGSNAVAKKGGAAWPTLATNTRKAKRWSTSRIMPDTSYHP